VGVLFALYNLSRPGRQVTVQRRHLSLHPRVMLALVRLSGAGMFQVFVGMASWIGLVRILASFGSAAVAGYTIGIRIILFALLPSWGLANAAATMVGQNLGAGKPDRAEKAVKLAGQYNMVFLGLVGLLFVLGANLIVSWFTRDVAVAPIAVNCLRIVSLGFVFYAWGMVLTNSFNGAGDTWTPTLINLGCFWALEIPLAWFLAEHTPAGPTGVFWAVTTAFSMVAVVSAVLFRRGKWKLKKV
jgi:Na+-driven multidrug efflux pump